jgi:hypothetical protein
LIALPRPPGGERLEAFVGFGYPREAGRKTGKEKRAKEGPFRPTESMPLWEPAGLYWHKNCHDFFLAF